jgi:hypothetical protein
VGNTVFWGSIAVVPANGQFLGYATVAFSEQNKQVESDEETPLQGT